MQTLRQPEIKMMTDNNSYYAYEDKNWVRFDDGKQFAGFWAYADNETGTLNALGFLEADVACIDNFKAQVEVYNWASVIPGTEVERPALPDGIRLSEPDVAGDHDHGKVPSDALLVVTIIVYVLIFLCLVGLAVMHFKKK